MSKIILHPKAKKKGKIEIADKKIITGEFRLSYPFLFKKKVYKGKEIGYGINMIFSKDEDISALEIAAHNAAIEMWGPEVSSWPSKKIRSKKTGKVINKCLVEMPFKDGDILNPDKPEYENSIFVNASNKKNQPGVIDQKKRPIEDESGIKAGDYARASLIAFAYNDEENGSYGVSFALMNVQKLRTGEQLGGARSAAAEFDEVESDEDEVLDMEDEDQNESEEDETEEDETEEDEEEEEEEEVVVKKKKKVSKR